MFVYFSDPYVKIVLFRGDRDIGQIDTAQTKRLKKVQTYICCFFFFSSELGVTLPQDMSGS